VYSPEPADCQGEVAAPFNGFQPDWLSHWAVKRTLMSPVVPSPANCARAPSCPPPQALTFAHDEAS
jgi:hypothetical protein